MLKIRALIVTSDSKVAIIAAQDGRHIISARQAKQMA
jgi:hypothetical protein